MSTNIRRLMFDINPWVWASIAFVWLCMVPSDILSLSTGARAGLPLVPAILCNGLWSWSNLKVPLWRTLPVTRREVDLARWWQGIAGAGVLLTAALLAGVAMNL